MKDNDRSRDFNIPVNHDAISAQHNCHSRLRISSNHYPSVQLYTISDQALSMTADRTADVIKDMKDNDVDSLHCVFHALKIEPCRLRLVSTSPVIRGKNKLMRYDMRISTVWYRPSVSSWLDLELSVRQSPPPSA